MPQPVGLHACAALLQCRLHKNHAQVVKSRVQYKIQSRVQSRFNNFMGRKIIKIFTKVAVFDLASLKMLVHILYCLPIILRNKIVQREFVCAATTNPFIVLTRHHSAHMTFGQHSPLPLLNI